MGSLNWARVLGGGLLAGLVINASEAVMNGVVLADQWAAVMRSMNKPAFSGGQIAVFNVLGFVMGIAVVWLYAAIRPRYGAGAKTALYAAGAFWFAAYLLPSVGQITMDLFPLNLVLIGLVWGLAEVVVGTLLGAKVYKE